MRHRKWQIETVWRWECKFYNEWRQKIRSEGEQWYIGMDKKGNPLGIVRITRIGSYQSVAHEAIRPV